MKYILLLLCVLLAGLIFYQAQYYPNIDLQVSDDVPAELPEELTGEDGTQLKSIRAYEEIITRPLFSLDRKPPQIASKEVAASINAAELEGLILFGVVVSNETTYAIIGDGKKGETEQIKKGRSYRGWKVSEITSESVKFDGNGAQYELFLTPNENTKKSGFKNNKKPEAKRVIQNYKSIYRSSQNKSPIKINLSRTPNKSAPPSKVEQPVATEYNEAELEELYEQGGYQFEPDDEDYELEEENFDEGDYGAEFYEE